MTSVVRPAIHKNGVGAFIFQCRKLVFHYCERGGSSRGVIDFFKNDIIEFAKKNPQIEVVVQPRPAKHPCIRGFYMNGKSKVICVRNFDRKGVMEQVQLLRDTSGQKVGLFKKRVISDTPSVRGIWSPFHNRPHQI
ncbi:hypothetical protein K493DRAFT_207313 [Basidiobolus meristosporus CBS 931.73]|uniref:Large ribosomal subunit protein mL43 n=1 Tax=Basidiobolus meristosporus CBS 931.73 TaxID=1314790 RepID=A0A1Y1Z042_9FUNG|nr:hypothetical protein K493DRAFT_207313 [Basidiobolus meristosporus CBS 931.73]|eukprot:ORY03175.1 hypothetical protein K493DRAFT_207313 [Basidiobolus meristosporus CBS 931.73]